MTDTILTIALNAYRHGEAVAARQTEPAAALEVARAEGYERDSLDHDCFVHGFADAIDKLNRPK